jgi:hypothetical protein
MGLNNLCGVAEYKMAWASALSRRFCFEKWYLAAGFWTLYLHEMGNGVGKVILLDSLQEF